MSSRSRSEMAGAEMPPPWRLSPLRSDSTPPTRTSVSMAVEPTRCTSSTIWPSASSNVSPAATSRGSSLYATPTCVLVPAVGSSAVSRVKACPSASCTRPSRKHSMRILGPPRSSSTPTQRSARCAAWRAWPRRRRRSSTVPCEALRRTTSSPARIISVRTSRSSVAGPKVATILVRLSMSVRASLQVRGAPLEHRDGGQRLAFHELEKRPAPRRHIGNPILDSVLLDGRQRIAAAGERERLAAGDRLRDGAGAFAELLELEHADRPVPDDGARRLEQRAEAIGAVGTDIQDHLVGAHFSHRAHVGVRGGRELLAHHHIGRQRDRGAAAARLVHEAAGDVQHLRLVQ